MVGASNRPPPSAQGNLISEYLPNVRTKQQKTKHHKPSPSPSGASDGPTTTSIADITSAIAALELSTNRTTSTKPRRCTCNASLHPLFTPVPNCLSCGHIICALEGLQPCSSCGARILSPEETQSMITTLRQERGAERQSAHNRSIASSRTGTPTLTPTLTPTQGPTPSSSAENLAALTAAKAHRDKLLSFQSQNTARTKIHDDAADFSDPMAANKAQWMTPLQRAAALKQQQRYLRELEEQNRPEYEKTRQVMSLGFNKQGKLVRTYGREKTGGGMATEAATAKEDAEEAELAAALEESAAIAAADRSGSRSSESKGAFSNNPLLKSRGLVRPIWTPREGDLGDQAKGKGPERDRTRTWRRVQDDDDNEQWVL
jgi:hexokinase